MGEKGDGELNYFVFNSMYVRLVYMDIWIMRRYEKFHYLPTQSSTMKEKRGNNRKIEGVSQQEVLRCIRDINKFQKDGHTKKGRSAQVIKIRK